MKLIDYAKKLFAKGPELWEDAITVKDGKTTIKRDTAKLRKCSIGLVSCNEPSEWYLVIRREAPTGTSIEPFEDDAVEWKSLFESTRVLVRADLTRSLLMERNAKSAKVLLDVMARRDPEHWADNQKKVEVAATDGDRELKISIAQI